MTPRGRIAVHTFVAIFLATTFTDAIAPINPLHQSIENQLGPILDFTGLWQSPWDLFAPEPDKINIRVSASFVYQDGSSGTWYSPDWTRMSIFQRMLHFRDMEFIDGIRRDNNKGAWESFADYLAREQTKQGRQVKHIVLARHWGLLKPPSEAFLPFGFYAPFRESFRFYEKNYLN